jgi:hypothetical protein
MYLAFVTVIIWAIAVHHTALMVIAEDLDRLHVSNLRPARYFPTFALPWNDGIAGKMQEWKVGKKKINGWR